MSDHVKLAEAAVLPESIKVPAQPEPQILSKEEQKQRFDELIELMKVEDAQLVAHYYTDPLVQALAEASGGFIGDSLEMARFGAETEASTLLVAGVRFMGESAKILSPEKRVIMPTLGAECSLDLACPAKSFAELAAQHPDRTKVVYANTSAEVKAEADWVVTSSIAVDVIEFLAARGEKILWAPDQHLGRYIADKTDADVLLWNGACIVHEEFKARGLKELKQLYPEAAVLVHPESPSSVVELADVVGSTTQLLKASQQLPNPQFIVATDRGIFYKMQQASPQKSFIEAPTAGHGATCRSCAHCPWMAMNDLDRIERVLRQKDQEVFVDETIRVQALKPLQRMLDFAAGNRY